MARLEHDHFDARKRAQTLIALEAERVIRRMKRLAEDYVAEAYADCAVRGKPFDHVKVADAAIKHAQAQYLLDATATAEIEAEASEVPAS